MRNNNQNIGEVLRLLRIANDLTIKEMANKMSVSSAYISAIERGKRKPSDNIIDKYSEVLNVSKTTISFFDEENKNHNHAFQTLLFKILQKIVNEEEIHE